MIRKIGPFFSAATTIMLIFGIAAVASADLLPPNHTAMQLSDEEPTEEAVFPDPVVLEKNSLRRATGDDDHSVSGYGFLRIDIEGYEAEHNGGADRFEPSEVEDATYGLIFELQGLYPDTLSIPEGPVIILDTNDGLEINWLDDETRRQEIDATITATWVDRYGRQGPTSDSVHIYDGGAGVFGCGGCTTTSSGSGTTLAIVVALMLLFLVHRPMRIIG